MTFILDLIKTIGDDDFFSCSYLNRIQHIFFLINWDLSAEQSLFCWLLLRKSELQTCVTLIGLISLYLVSGSVSMECGSRYELISYHTIVVPLLLWLQIPSASLLTSRYLQCSFTGF